MPDEFEVEVKYAKAYREFQQGQEYRRGQEDPLIFQSEMFRNTLRNPSDLAATDQLQAAVELTATHETIYLPDGYNGHTMLFFTKPLETDGDLVKLQCAEPGKEYMFTWRHRSVVVSSWMKQASENGRA